MAVEQREVYLLPSQALQDDVNQLQNDCIKVISAVI